MARETPSTRTRGTFISFEGGEGAGKTTQAQLLQKRLERLGRRVRVTREPGGTSLGEKLREIIFHPGLEPETELLLILADRAQHVAEVIRPALERGETVVCDRYSDSTVAYQGHGRGLDLAAIATANELASAGVRPDLSILLELPVDVGLSRQAGGTEWDSIGQESREFHERVHAGFRLLAAEEPERWMVVDASLPVERVSDLIWERVKGLSVEESAGSDRAPA
ncbi:MAG: dTMP kinase [Dehalococcoidia bacterium]|jgi:dTMP kinase